MTDKFKQIFTKEILLAVLYVIVISGGLINVYYGETKPVFSLWNNKRVILIDAGHGGWDPGKLGLGETPEKDVNLSIANKLQTLLELTGSYVVTTRAEDKSVGETKSSDLKGRIEISNETGAEMFISIHQNSYPDESIKGAQVFYFGDSKNSEKLAKIIQEELKQLNPANKRVAMANNDYYVLKNTKMPAVIVECGFLSNAEEAGLLSDDAYQLKVAWAVYNAVVKYYGDYEPAN